MIVGKIVGNIVCTQKDENLVGKKMLLVQPLNVKSFQPQGGPIVALDAVGAGEGEVVLLVGGSSARLADSYSTVPVDQAIVGILDSIDIEGKLVYKKQK